MNIVYSNKKINGLVGVYANPDLFNGDTENVEVCYTDNESIKQAYEKKGISVSPLPKRRTATKAEE